MKWPGRSFVGSHPCASESQPDASAAVMSVAVAASRSIWHLPGLQFPISLRLVFLQTGTSACPHRLPRPAAGHSRRARWCTWASAAAAATRLRPPALQASEQAHRFGVRLFAEDLIVKIGGDWLKPRPLAAILYLRGLMGVAMSRPVYLRSGNHSIANFHEPLRSPIANSEEILGARFRCVHCPAFDLCLPCLAAAGPDHPAEEEWPGRAAGPHVFQVMLSPRVEV